MKKLSLLLLTTVLVSAPALATEVRKVNIYPGMLTCTAETSLQVYGMMVIKTETAVVDAAALENINPAHEKLQQYNRIVLSGPSGANSQKKSICAIVAQVLKNQANGNPHGLSGAIPATLTIDQSTHFQGYIDRNVTTETLKLDLGNGLVLQSSVQINK